MHSRLRQHDGRKGIADAAARATAAMQTCKPPSRLTGCLDHLQTAAEVCAGNPRPTEPTSALGRLPSSARPQRLG